MSNTKYKRGAVPGSPGGLPSFLEKELDRIQRAIATAGSATDWSTITGVPANVSAFAALTGSANQVPYFTGLGTLALTSLTPYAITILACSSAAAMRTVLGLGALAVLNGVTETTISLSDVTTLNVSDTQHGLAPKNPNDATKYLDGTGAYSVPAGSGGSYPPPLGTFPSIADLELRLSAELSTMTIGADGLITQIDDLSGNWGSNFTSSTIACPRLVANAMAGMRPGLIFDGAESKLVAGGTKTLAQPCSVVVVFMNWKGGAANGNLYRDSNSGPVAFNSGGTAWAIYAGGATVSSSPLYAQNTQALQDGVIGAPAIQIAVFNGASSVLSNNSVEITGSPGASGFSGTLYVGGDSATSFAHMIFYELLIFSHALTLTERGELNTYYANALNIYL